MHVFSSYYNLRNNSYVLSSVHSNPLNIVIVKFLNIMAMDQENYMTILFDIIM